MTTTLVLPPYSAGGAPSITSMAWIESAGIWFEKTLALLVSDRLTIHGKRIFSVIANP